MKTLISDDDLLLDVRAVSVVGAVEEYGSGPTLAKIIRYKEHTYLDVQIDGGLIRRTYEIESAPDADGSHEYYKKIATTTMADLNKEMGRQPR